MGVMLQMAMVQMQMKAKKLFTDERGDVNIVSIVVLIGIVVILAVVFRGQIEGLINKLFAAIEGKALTTVGGSASSQTSPTP